MGEPGAVVIRGVRLIVGGALAGAKPVTHKEFWLLAVIWIGGCAALGPRPFEVRGLQFYNAGTAAVDRVSIRVPHTGAVASCGFIPVKGECSTTFPARHYRGHPVEVAWASGGRQWSSGPVVLQPLSEASRDTPQQVQVWLDDFGAVEIFLAE